MPDPADLAAQQAELRAQIAIHDAQARMEQAATYAQIRVLYLEAILVRMVLNAGGNVVLSADEVGPEHGRLVEQNLAPAVSENGDGEPRVQLTVEAVPDEPKAKV